ncbi:MAG: ABC transporter permease [Candidatus Zixiibacteriota bacterium]
MADSGAGRKPARWFSWPRFLAIAGKEFIHIRRDRPTLGIMLGVPVIQITLFGFAVNTTVDHIPLVVCDLSRSKQAREFVDRLVNTSYFDLVGGADSYLEAKALIDHEQAKAAILFPPDYPEKLVRGEASIGALVDASDPLLASSALSAAAQVGRALNIEIIRAQAPGVTPAALPVDVRVRALYNPDLRSPVYIVPGLIGVILTMTMALVTAAAIVRERESGALEALITTPVSKIELMLGKIIPYIVVGYIQMTVVLVVANYMFDVRSEGSVALLYSVAFLFIVASLGVGMVISTIARTQMQAMQMSFFFFLPNILLSGFMFPISSMPEIIQGISYALPLRYFLVFLRGVLLKGAGASELWSFIWPLAVFAPVLVTIGVMRFSKKLS